jgi:recombinational DNA repair protein RecT
MPSSNQRPQQHQRPQQPQPAQAVERSRQPPPEQPTISAFDVLRADLDRNRGVFQPLLGNKRSVNDSQVDTFIMTCYQHVWHKPDLLGADRDSLLLAFAEAAVTGLDLNPTSKEGYIEIRSGIARFATQYQGLIKMMHRGNDIDYMHVDVVRRGDMFRQIGGSGPRIEHVTAELGCEPEDYDTDAAILASYATVRLNGSSHAMQEVARRSAIDKAMAMSKGKGGKPPSPAWASWYDRMAMKLPVRRISNYLPGADEIRTMMSVEDARDHDRFMIHPRVAEVFGNIEAPRAATRIGPTNADRLASLVASSGPAGADILPDHAEAPEPVNAGR